MLRASPAPGSTRTTDNMVIRIKPKRPWHGIQTVRVSTVEHPGWVAFKEIRVLR
jgi:hypothetical protein